MRLYQTGTGLGKVIGRGRVEFHSQRGRVIQCASVGWNGDPALIPFLPGLAFDENLPNVRAILGEGPNTLYGPGATRYGMDAHKVVLAEFVDWTLKAQQRVDRESVLPTFEVMTLAALAQGELVVDRLDYVVRINEKKARMSMETSYSSKHARAALYASMHQLFWDWVASRDEGRDVAVMLTALSRQFEHYRVNGIPADFMLRQIGRAPLAAWSAFQSTVTGPEL
jgi:hypothetical protein